MLGISVDLFSPVPLEGSIVPTVVYFAKVDDEQGLFQPRVVESDYSSGGLYYASNVQPGTYVAIGAQVSPRKDVGVGFTIYFSTGIMERTRTTVGHRELAFMGNYWVYMFPGLWGADAAQKHYAALITPTHSKGLLSGLIGDTYYRGVLLRSRKDDKSKEHFLRYAQKDLDVLEAAVPGVRVAERFYWTGPDGNLGLEIQARFQSQDWLDSMLRADRVIGRFEDKNPPHALRDWTFREILVSVNLNAAETAAIWRVSGPGPLIAAYAEGLVRLSKKYPLVRDISYRAVKFRPAAK